MMHFAHWMHLGISSRFFHLFLYKRLLVRINITPSKLNGTVEFPKKQDGNMKIIIFTEYNL